MYENNTKCVDLLISHNDVTKVVWNISKVYVIEIVVLGR